MRGFTAGSARPGVLHRGAQSGMESQVPPPMTNSRLPVINPCRFRDGFDAGPSFKSFPIRNKNSSVLHSRATWTNARNRPSDLKRKQAVDSQIRLRAVDIPER